MSDTAIPLVSANVATIFLESFLYGNFFVLTVSSVYLLAYRQKRILASQHPQGAAGAVAAGLLRSPMFLGAISLFITITAVRGHVNFPALTLSPLCSTGS